MDTTAMSSRSGREPRSGAIRNEPALRSSMRSNGGGKQVKLSKKGRVTRHGWDRLLNREALDGRTAIAKVYDHLVAQIHADLGGRDRLTAVQLSLVEAFAGASVTLDNINTRILAGAEINNAMVSMHSSAISAMVRVASRLPNGRI